MEPLDLLEELLSLTERFKSLMTSEECRTWQRISAKTADIRECDGDLDAAENLDI